MAALVATVALPARPAAASSDPSTFSIVAYDSITGELGVAVQSKYFSVGRTVPWAKAGVGAVATQANVNASYGPRADPISAQLLRRLDTRHRPGNREADHEARAC